MPKYRLNKHWKIYSTALLLALGGAGLTTANQNNVHASTKNSVPQTTSSVTMNQTKAHFNQLNQQNPNGYQNELLNNVNQLTKNPNLNRDTDNGVNTNHDHVQSVATSSLTPQSVAPIVATPSGVQSLKPVSITPQQLDSLTTPTSQSTVSLAPSSIASSSAENTNISSATNSVSTKVSSSATNINSKSATNAQSQSSSVAPKSTANSNASASSKVSLNSSSATSVKSKSVQTNSMQKSTKTNLNNKLKSATNQINKNIKPTTQNSKSHSANSFGKFVTTRAPYRINGLKWNTRDLGGYKSKYGTVKSNLLIRSSRLDNLTPQQIKQLQSMNVTNIIDLRNKSDWQKHPDTNEQSGNVGNIPYLHIPVYTKAEHKQFGKIKNFYGTEAVDGNTALKAYKSIFNDLLNSKGTTIFHCDSGHDRTGVVAGVILSALGVPRKSIINDYLLTGNYRNYKPRRMHRQARQIKTFFKTIDTKYGNMHNYLTKGIGLTPTQIYQLRNKYLEK